MKSKLIPVYAALAGVLVFSISSRAESPGDCFPDENPHWRCGHMNALEDLANPHGGPGPGNPQPETPWTDVINTKIDIELILTARTITGTVTIVAQSRINGLSSFVCYLNPTGGAMSATAVGGAAVNYTHTGDKFVMTLDQAYDIGEEFTVSISYAGAPIDGIYWGNYGSGSASHPIVATLSQTFSARGWWPGKDVLDDKSTFDIWVTVPETYTVASNGLLEGVDLLSGVRKRFRWRESYPMTAYLASIAVAKYVQYNLTYSHLGDTMPMNFFLMADHNVPLFQTSCQRFVTQTATFSDLFGQYPFIAEKGGLAETPTLWPFNMEHQTLSSVTNVLPESVNAHELAHQWWGDEITCETWSDIWLNEGMATFSEALWAEFRPGGNAGYYWGVMSQNRPHDTDALLYVHDVSSFNSILGSTVYRKGAWVAHMLRHVVGSAAFFQGLRDYRAAHGGRSATTAEFIDTMSASVGWDLTWFTNQWVMNAGSPDYSYAVVPGLVAGQDYAFVYIDQTQTTRGFPLMTMPVVIVVNTASGASSFTMWVQDASNAFAIPVGSPLLGASFDPDRWVLTHSITSMSSPAAPPPCQGDANGDGARDGRDIQAFVNAATGVTSGPAAWKRSDMNFDGRTNAGDVDRFIAVLLGTMPCP